MGNRGQKRAEMVDELPADKRACSSLEFRPSSSNSLIQTQINTETHNAEIHDADMDTSSSGSASSHSDEEEPEMDSAHGSCDSEGPRHSSLREYQRQRSSGDHSRLKSCLFNLSERTEPSGQLAALTELCEVLSFCTEDSLSSTMADLLSPVLVRLSRHDSNPDIMLLAIRALTYLCDVFPRASVFLVRHDAIPAICQRLMAIEYLDVAEQCLQALEKITRDQPLPCLQAGAIMAVLSFIDFFSTSVQRVALSTVVNICKKLPSENFSPFMEAVPILCNLLQYEDRQLVENVAICLIKIAERVSQSSEMLDELCKHGLINQATHLVQLNSRTTLSQPVYNGLIGLLVKLSSGSIVAFRTLYELNISSILKDLFATYDLSHGISSPHVIDGQGNQVHEVLKLLNELLPTVARNQDAQQLVLDKEAFLANHPDLLHKFGSDIIPSLIQVVNSGANLYVCYGCLYVINKLVYLSKSDMLLELLKNTNFSSFLAGVLTRKDHHVLMLALQITETILQKLPDVFVNSFIKEGVFFAIDGLLVPEKCSQLIFPACNGIHLPLNSNQKSSSKVVMRCLCYAFDTGQSLSASETGTCKLEKDTVENLGKHIRISYFALESCDSEKGLTDILQKLRALSAELSDLMNMSVKIGSCTQDEEKCYSILCQIMEKLDGREPVSTFEFIESGIVKILVNYLFNGKYLREKVEPQSTFDDFYVVEKRFEVFARLLSSSDLSEESPLSALIQKLQGALSSSENFPVILSHASKYRSSFAIIPNGRRTSYPCLRVRFVRGEGETCLCNYSEDPVTVDPLSSVNTIEGFLSPKVRIKGTEQIESAAQALEPAENVQFKSPSTANPSEGESSGLMEPDSMAFDLLVMQDNEANLSQPPPELDVNLIQRNPDETLSNDTHIVSVEDIVQSPSCADDSTKSHCPTSCSNGDAMPKLVFYLEGQQLDRTLTLYQAILQQKVKADHEINSTAKLWTQVHTLTYRIAVDTRDDNTQDCPRLIDNLDNLRVAARPVAQNEFVSSKLTEKLEQQMRDSLAVSMGGMPVWCNQLMNSCSFLFSFETRCKYFQLSAFGCQQIQIQPSSHNNSGVLRDRLPSAGSLSRKKFIVLRDQVLESAAQMMDRYAHLKVPIEVVYNEEVGTGLGPTLEFYTLVSKEFQKSGIGMWREDHISFPTIENLQAEYSGIVKSPFGLFPRPWSPTVDASDGVQFSEVIKKFFLLGQIVAKALQDGRVLDLPFAKVFYKLILQQELNLYDIQSFDPELGRTLLEFQALVNRKKNMGLVIVENSSSTQDACFWNTRIEDLCLDFTLPGYSDYILSFDEDHKIVNMDNLEVYVSHIVDATIHTGISRQVEAFKSGFNQVFPIKHLMIFTEEELERLLCGERDFWAFNELLDHIKFDHGYTASSPPIVNLLEIIKEFEYEQRRSFLQFVTGAPRLPTGGLASLNPKLTIVRKHCSNCEDVDLPSVMTCANYLKLPPYSSKDKMKEKLLYAITEGQGSFHLS
ncbi:E3 ubiquitin-protein ligase UPL4 isoform X2 [Populus trichocarpa]|uniref:E3 ubiquitin-protein ligase UPL4 isoform X2 n=1 Tax=Populus trichocarpa TaxID=3694 RepID=UPI000D1890CA|nr:E3 ubiquitin-protein ligase UPL4 isoform X2 [Populus trichocarpa]|eukprot:XP_024443585.1 E3 ubiquitin-protein ligase UPL4 isoform X2 [Populus trichocarpa]